MSPPQFYMHNNIKSYATGSTQKTHTLNFQYVKPRLINILGLQNDDMCDYLSCLKQQSYEAVMQQDLQLKHDFKPQQT